MLTEVKHLIKRLLRHLVYSDEQWLVILVLCVCVIHGRYLQIVAGRFPLNKELAFELAALMAQVSSFARGHFLST